jgi:N-acetyl-anhydromuramyl-L-alanine amidase AmpD
VALLFLKIICGYLIEKQPNIIHNNISWWQQIKNNQGRKSDGGIKFVYKNLEQQLFYTEIKNPRVINEDEVCHPDFVKLCNLLKDEIDLLLTKNCPFEIPVVGALVGDK